MYFGVLFACYKAAFKEWRLMTDILSYNWFISFAREFVAVVIKARTPISWVGLESWEEDIRVYPRPWAFLYPILTV